MAMSGSPGDMSYLPSSSSFGLPTSFDFSNVGVPTGMLGIILAIVGVLILMNFLKMGKRR